LLTDQEAGRFRGLLIDGQKAHLIEEEAAVVVNVVTDLPADPDATSLEVFGGSPFLMHHQLLGEPFTNWLESRSTFLGVVSLNWHDVVRWYGFYTRRDWMRFDTHAREYWRDDWPAEPTMLQRHDGIHRALDVIFVPVFPGGEYPRWKYETRLRSTQLDWPAAASFAKTWTRGREVGALQQTLFDLLDHFVQLRWAILPGLVLNLYDVHNVSPNPKWRIARDDFRVLRDLYISVFESGYRYLPVVMAFCNCLERGGPERFPDGLSRALSKVDTFRAVDREKLLGLFDPWGPQVRGLLNRKLRNAIGHASAMHDLVSAEVVTRDISMPYVRFVSLVAASVQVPILCLDMLKLLLIMEMYE